ncbi:MAG TPA: GIY-YIG nuclease family protein [Candidatus Saccharimonadales bacterium]|nr:GIY-YIG nuclease family protein [Candidatus Saccharimonadales bacterium]
MKQYYVYIMANDRPTLYIGVTNDLKRRVFEHKEAKIPGFTNRYALKKLVYFEQCDSIETAITREKHLKHWKRAWKLELIQKDNPDLNDLYENIV